jgi:uncharacterized membrane protein
MALATALAIVLMLQVLPPSDRGTNIQMLLRWIHFLAGITWIGLLYFFNLVNVPVMKALDGPTKGKVVPVLMPKALWWFRWGAVVTVLAGVIYYLIILSTEPPQAPGSLMWATFGKWLVLVVVTWAIISLLTGPVNNGWLLAALVVVLVGAMGGAIVHFNTYEGASNRAVSIGVGGGIGTIMLLNVWGIIWPAQKRIIAWTKANAEQGTPVPPESAKLARRAFLASRSNAWLSIPMLFFMAAASHYPLFGK